MQFHNRALDLGLVKTGWWGTAVPGWLASETLAGVPQGLVFQKKSTTRLRFAETLAQKEATRPARPAADFSQSNIAIYHTFSCARRR
jgi:hypothetical protein